jgi:hypothetical protein
LLAGVGPDQSAIRSGFVGGSAPIADAPEAVIVRAVVNRDAMPIREMTESVDRAILVS